MAVFLAIPIIGAVQAAIAALGLMPASSKSPALIGAALGSFGAALAIAWRIGSPLESAVGEARKHAGERDLAQLTLFRAGCIGVGLLFCAYLFYAGRAARGL